MKKQLALRFIIFCSLLITVSLLLLVSSNFSESAILNVLSTFALIILLAVIIV